MKNLLEYYNEHLTFNKHISISFLASFIEPL